MPNILPPVFPFDPAGQSPANLIANEQQVLSVINGANFHFVVPESGPYFATSLVVTITDGAGAVKTLVEGIDYLCAHEFISASRACAMPIYGSISFLDLTLAGIVKLKYQTLGGDWTLNTATIAVILSDTVRNPRITAWEQITNYPVGFPPIPHQWNLVDMIGMKEVVAGLSAIEVAIVQRILVSQQEITNLAPHLADFNNPHRVNYQQVGAYSIAQVDFIVSKINARLAAIEAHLGMPTPP